jgi:hypothetical protein
MTRYFDKSQKVSTNLKNLENLEILESLNENLNAAESRLKSLNFKNLDREKKSWSQLSRKS